MSAAPLVRQVFETAVTAHWIAQTRDGANALLKEDVRIRRAIQEEMGRARSPILRDDPRVAGTDLAALDTTAAGQARNFGQLCQDLDVDLDLYIYYRLLSGYSHPSTTVVDEWIGIGADDKALLFHEPQQMPPMLGGFIAWSLVWAGRAVDFFDQRRRRRNQLRQAARALAIPDSLPLTARARLERGH